jgi:hypothetical protein
LAAIASASIFISWPRKAATPLNRSKEANRRVDGKVDMGRVGIKTPLRYLSYGDAKGFWGD